MHKFRLAVCFCVSAFLFALPAYAHHPGYSPASGVAAKDEGPISAGPMVNSPTATTLDKGQVSTGFVFNYVNFYEIAVN